jgi:hypothetical protein
MRKKGLLAIIIAMFVGGMAFAQIDTVRMPANTITVDFGPTIVGAVFGALGDIIGEDGLSSSGFGIAAQYERQLFQQLSVAGRFAYLGFGFGVLQEESGIRAELDMDLSSFSLEGHVRYYPFGETFFLNGMLGYANLQAALSGQVIAGGMREPVNFTASRDYVKFGGKLGWRISFGRSGGFTFEPSIGYYGGIGLGDTFGQKLYNEVGRDVSEYDEVFTLLENFIFIGGPRVSLSFGWRF